MGKRSDKRKQGYVDRMRNIYKVTCLIHGIVHSSDKLKVLKYIGTKHAEGGPFKDCRQDTTFNESLKKNKEVNAIIQHSVDGIMLQ